MEEITMKKVTKALAFLAALCLLVSVFAITAVAAGSKSEASELTITKDGQPVDYSTDSNVPVKLDAKTAAALLNGAGISCTENQLSVIWQQNVTTAAEMPVQVTVNLDLKAGQDGYVFHYENGAWVYMGKANTPITFNSLSPIGVVVKSDTPASESVANTNDNNLVVAIVCGAVVVIGLIGTVVTISLKKKNEA